MGWQRLRVIALWSVLAGAAWQFGGAAYIHVKAVLAQTLLRDAWAQTLRGSRNVRPWPWADTWPVARLRAPRHDQHLIVLAGASGRTLAFAPGHLHGSAALAQPGRTVIAGHRDTHFAFLQQLRLGDELLLQDHAGFTHRFRVSDTRVVDSLTARLSLDGAKQLVLITCFPFDALAAGGPMRFVVLAEPGSGAPAQNSPQLERGAGVIRPGPGADSRA